MKLQTVIIFKFPPAPSISVSFYTFLYLPSHLSLPKSSPSCLIILLFPSPPLFCFAQPTLYTLWSYQIKFLHNVSGNLWSDWLCWQPAVHHYLLTENWSEVFPPPVFDLIYILIAIKLFGLPTLFPE